MYLCMLASCSDSRACCFERLDSRVGSFLLALGRAAMPQISWLCPSFENGIKMYQVIKRPYDVLIIVSEGLLMAKQNTGASACLNMGLCIYIILYHFISFYIYIYMYTYCIHVC